MVKRVGQVKNLNYRICKFTGIIWWKFTLSMYNICFHPKGWKSVPSAMYLCTLYKSIYWLTQKCKNVFLPQLMNLSFFPQQLIAISVCVRFFLQPLQSSHSSKLAAASAVDRRPNSFNPLLLLRSCCRCRACGLLGTFPTPLWVAVVAVAYRA